ncbi:hypothetical protein GCM10023178_70320 [Actinomadura luteofluorescens]
MSSVPVAARAVTVVQRVLGTFCLLEAGRGARSRGDRPEGTPGRSRDKQHNRHSTMANYYI